MKGFIRDILDTECPQPHATPKYYDEDDLEATTAETPTIGNEQELEDELMALQLMVEELQLLAAIEADEAALQDLAFQSAPIEASKETGEKKATADKMVGDLVIMGFDKDMAVWAVQESKEDWGEAVDLAHKRLQDEEHQMLVQQEEEEEERKKALRKGSRELATPCRSTSMPPPPVPTKRLFGKTKSPDTITKLGNLIADIAI